MPQNSRHGAQEPTFTTAPPACDLDGEGAYAVEVLESYGVQFMPSQRYEMQLYLARDASGDFAAKTVAVSKPRQNGKSYAARFYALWCACVLGLGVLYTAHQGKTVRHMFKELTSFIMQTPDFRRLLVPKGGIYRAAGSEGIYFVGPDGKPGGYIEFQTRTQAGGRGSSYSVCVIDEAQEYTEAQQEAIQPTLFAASDVGRRISQQMIYLGTPPGEKCTGTVFRDMHDKAHAGALYGAWWLEWAADEVPDASRPDDALEVAYRTNPAMGYRIRPATILDALGAMTPEGFAREVCGWWAPYTVGDVLIPESLWTRTASKDPAPEGVRAFAVKIEPGGTYAALAVAVRPAQGPARVELVRLYDTTHGLEELRRDVQRVARTAAEVVLDGGGYAQTLAGRLIRAGAPEKLIKRPTAVDVATASTNLLAMLKEGAVTHYAAPGQAVLDDSATKTTRRPVGRGGGFSFATTQDAYAEPIEAAALALLFVVRTKRDPSQGVQLI